MPKRIRGDLKQDEPSGKAIVIPAWAGIFVGAIVAVVAFFLINVHFPWKDFVKDELRGLGKMIHEERRRIDKLEWHIGRDEDED